MVKLSHSLVLLPYLFSAAVYASSRPVVVARALYFINNEAQNAVIAVKVNPDGTLSDGSVTLTGGAGGAGVNAQGEPAGPDPLFSQGALALSNGKLVVVNAGSNSITLFNVDSKDPTKLTRIGNPVNTMGDFPNSVAISSRLSQACVANTGVRAGIACFQITSRGLRPVDWDLRSLDIGQQNPPIGPTGTISQVSFSEDSTQLLVFVKGNPPTNTPGFVSVYPVQWNGRVSREEFRSNPNGTAVLFGSVQVPGTPRWVTTDPSVGGAVLEVNPRNCAVSTVTLSPIEGQMATCWATYSASTDTVYVTDGAVNRLTGIDPATGKVNSELALDNGSRGMLDLAAAGDFVYALSVGGEKAAITVLDVSGGNNAVKVVQNFQPAGMVDMLKVQGMAVCE